VLKSPLFFVILFIGAVTGLAVGMSLGAQPSLPRPDFTLQTPDGTTVKLSDLRGQPTLLYFGYTFCPDICPEELSRANEAVALLGKVGSQVNLVFITVDPERDTPERLQAFTEFINPDIIALTGDQTALDEAIATFRVVAERTPGPTEDFYYITHTTKLFLLDSKGYQVADFFYQTPPAVIATGIRPYLRK
jgi:protein SCO1/2